MLAKNYENLQNSTLLLFSATPLFIPAQQYIFNMFQFEVLKYRTTIQLRHFTYLQNKWVIDKFVVMYKSHITALHTDSFFVCFHGKYCRTMWVCASLTRRPKNIDGRALHKDFSSVGKFGKHLLCRLWKKWHISFLSTFWKNIRLLFLT